MAQFVHEVIEDEKFVQYRLNLENDRFYLSEVNTTQVFFSIFVSRKLCSMRRSLKTYKFHTLKTTPRKGMKGAY